MEALQSLGGADRDCLAPGGTRPDHRRGLPQRADQELGRARGGGDGTGINTRVPFIRVSREERTRASLVRVRGFVTQAVFSKFAGFRPVSRQRQF